MNFRDILITANGNLRKSKLRTALTIIAVFIGALTLMLTTGVGAGLKTYVNEQVNAVGAKDVMIITGASEQLAFGGSDQPKEYNPDKPAMTNTGFTMVTLLQPSDIQKIQDTPGIISVQPLYDVSVEYVTGAANTAKYEATASQTIDGMIQPLVAGQMVSGTSDQFQVTIPQSFVSALGFTDDQAAIGQTITFAFQDSQGKTFTKEATVVGVQEKTLINSDGGITTNSAFAKAVYEQTNAALPAFQQNRFTNVIAKFDPAMSEPDRQALKQSLKDQGYDAITLQDQLGVVNDIIDAVTIFLNVFAAIALLAASFGIVNTLLMAVQERTREIGLMKALGMSRGRIFTLFSLEAILIGFWGAIIALGVANLLGRLGSRIATNTIFKAFDGLQLFSFPWRSMVPIILLIMAIAFLAATLPARRAAKLDPIEALRYE